MILKKDEKEKIFTLVAHPYKEEDDEEDSFKKKNSRTTYSKRTTRKSRSGMGLILMFCFYVIRSAGFVLNKLVLESAPGQTKSRDISLSSFITLIEYLDF